MEALHRFPEIMLFVWLNALISGTIGYNLKTIFVLDSPFIEESYKAILNHIDRCNVVTVCIAGHSYL